MLGLIIAVLAFGYLCFRHGQHQERNSRPHVMEVNEKKIVNLNAGIESRNKKIHTLSEEKRVLENRVTSLLHDVSEERDHVDMLRQANQDLQDEKIEAERRGYTQGLIDGRNKKLCDSTALLHDIAHGFKERSAVTIGLDGKLTLNKGIK
jgi:hypothetical protein